MRSRVLVLALAIASALPIAGARAQERPLAERLTVSDADSCLAPDALSSSARAWLGRDAIDASLSILVALGREGRAADVVLLRGEEVVGIRRFDVLPPECGDRRALLGLSIALAIDATVLDALGRTEERGEGRRVDAARREGERSVAVALELAGEGGIGIGLPWDLSALGAALVGVRIDGVVRIDLGALGTSTVAIPVGGGRADVMLVAARAQACVITTLAPIELGGCLGAVGGAALASGRGFLHNRSAGMPWVAGSVRLEVMLGLAEPIALGFVAEGLFGLVRPRLEVLGPDGIPSSSQALPAAGLALSLGARVRFR